MLVFSFIYALHLIIRNILLQNLKFFNNKITLLKQSTFFFSPRLKTYDYNETFRPIELR